MSNLDRVFKAYDIRGVYPEDIHELLAWKVGYATGQFLRSLLSGYDRGQASANRLVVGRDMRSHGEGLTQHLIEGILASGLSCVDLGRVDTPMVSFAINHLGTCGGVMVTASHNPPEYNGFKISGQKARPIGDNTGLKEIRHLVSKIRRTPRGDDNVQVQQRDLWSEYRKHVLRFLRLNRPMRIAVDASNSMGAMMMPRVFEDTDVEILPINFEMDGVFAHPPNPLVDSNLDQLRQFVRENPVDFGICFDGDADRCMFVDETGEIVRCDIVTALLARHFLASQRGATVVYDLRSSRVVAEEILAADGVPRRERVGHAFMKKALADSHGVFGGEVSGHFYFRDNFNADSGAIVFAVVASIVSEQNKPFSGLVAPLKRYCQTGEINFRVPEKAEKMEQLAKEFSDGKVDRLDGVTIEYDDWWFNVRPSNTEPLLRLNLEARDERQLRKMLRRVQTILGEPVDE